MADNPASILTQKQRNFLDGEEVGHPNKLRQRLRDRVYTALRIEGPVLMERLPAEERRAIFRGWEKNWGDFELEPSSSEIALTKFDFPDISPENAEDAEQAERTYLRHGIENLLAFLYLGIEEGNLGDFDEILKSALSKAAHETDRSLTDFEFSHDMGGTMTYAPWTIAEMVREGEADDLTLNEIMFAIEKGELDLEEAEDALSDLTEFLNGLERLEDRNDEGGDK